MTNWVRLKVNELVGHDGLVTGYSVIPFPNPSHWLTRVCPRVVSFKRTVSWNLSQRVEIRSSYISDLEDIYLVVNAWSEPCMHLFSGANPGNNGSMVEIQTVQVFGDRVEIGELSGNPCERMIKAGTLELQSFLFHTILDYPCWFILLCFYRPVNKLRIVWNLPSST